jgi:hypothetical protein
MRQNKEVGELTPAQSITAINTRDATALNSWLTDKPATQVTRTVYDQSYFQGGATLSPQYLVQQSYFKYNSKPTTCILP